MFYKTDHHWNYKGAYQGYKNIVNMLFDGKEKVLEPKKLLDLKVKFNGSLARTSQIDYFADDFKVYEFDFDEHIEYIDKKISEYGNYKNYKDGKINDASFVNHYGEFYGVDYGEIVFDYYKNKDKKNILILSNSFSNAINNLIASHFHKTYVLDPRHYVTDDGKPFSYSKYIEDNKIDKVLVIGNITFFDDDNLGKLGGI